MSAIRSLVTWFLPVPVHRASAVPCCSVRTSSLEHSRVVNQTEYWLKYWYNDASDGEGQEPHEPSTVWEPPESDEEDDEDLELSVREGQVSALGMGTIASQLQADLAARRESAARKESMAAEHDSNGTVTVPAPAFAVARGMKFSIVPMMSPGITKSVPVAEPTELEPESYFSRLNSRIKTSLEASYGHFTTLKREHSEDADVDDSSLEESHCVDQNTNLEFHLSTSVDLLY